MRNYISLLFALLLVACNESPRFQLLSSKNTGIDFINEIVENDSMNVMKYEYVYNGAGTGIGDLNNDGLQDIVFAGNQVSPRIYLNLGDFKFKDITSNFPGLSNEQWYNGVTIVDINSDRWPDIYFTATESKDPEKRKNRLWINNGAENGMDPTFKEMAEFYGIADTSQSINAAFFDYDLDGDLDLYVLNNTVSQRMNTAYRQKMVDGTASNNDKLYRNNGDGTFCEISKQAGIVIEGFGLGLAIGDVNKDGYPDIYVSNDFISNDLLYINQGDGTFRNEISRYLSYQSKSSMGDDMADINNDGNPDIFSMDMFPENYYKKKQTINGFSYLFYIMDERYNFEHQYLRNMLHMHNGFLNGEMIPFSEVGQMLGIYQSDWSWSPLFADYDNDGDKDLIISNGFPRDMTDKDWTRFKVKAEGNYASNDILIDMAPAVKIPNLAFENMGDLRFEKRTNWLPLVPSFSYGSAFVDLDNDGDLDYVINNIDDEAFILKNNSVEKSKKHANFLRIRLLGKEGNTMAIGAKIEIWEKGNYQFIENFLTRGYASSVDPVIHFGLAKGISVDSIKVTWPAGNTLSVLKNVNTNTTIEIDESNAIPVKEIKNTLKSSDLLFVKSENLLDYSHQQRDFVDFSLNQKIIPHKFSQIGPRMAKGDINNDGKEDIIVGSTNILPTTVFLKQGKGFVESAFEGLSGEKEFSEADLAIVDIDRDGDNDVIALAGGYENSEEKEYKHYVYVNNNGSFNRKPLPIPQFPASVVLPFDFDHDGDIDLFVGSRVKKGMFPYANHSWLIHNDNGVLSVDSTCRLNLGMVTDAIWTDYDNDGWEDLLVAREWNSIVIMKNMNGKELVPRIIPSLESRHGIWFSLVAGDFDQDGDDDYIAGNIGVNHRFTVSDKFPLNMYVIDLEMDGIIDPITTAYWEDIAGKMTEYPVNYLDELWGQSNLLEARFKDYAPFSYVGFKDMFPESILDRLEFKLQVNTTSSYIIWNDNDDFRWEELPRSAQVSPIKKMVVDDFNNDNYPDVLLTGNDYSYDLATGYFDANKGIVLINKGRDKAKGIPSFDILQPSQSGFLLQGMVESLLYFEGDTSIIVAGLNRSKVSVYQHVK